MLGPGLAAMPPTPTQVTTDKFRGELCQQPKAGEDPLVFRLAPTSQPSPMTSPAWPCGARAVGAVPAWSQPPGELSLRGQATTFSDLHGRSLICPPPEIQLAVSLCASQQSSPPARQEPAHQEVNTVELQKAVDNHSPLANCRSGFPPMEVQRPFLSRSHLDPGRVSQATDGCRHVANNPVRAAVQSNRGPVVLRLSRS